MSRPLTLVGSEGVVRRLLTLSRPVASEGAVALARLTRGGSRTGSRGLLSMVSGASAAGAIGGSGTGAPIGGERTRLSSFSVAGGPAERERSNKKAPRRKSPRTTTPMA